MRLCTSGHLKRYFPCGAVAAIALTGLLWATQAKVCSAWEDPGATGFGERQQQTEQQQQEETKQAESVDPEEGFDKETQLESFDLVWNTVKRAHWDRELIKEKWESAREMFRPQVESAEDIKEVRRVIGEMLDTLEQSHFGIIPFEAYDIMEQRRRSGGSGYSGLRTRLIDGQLVVTRVQPNSPAEKAGIQTGWVIKSIGEKTAEQVIERTKKIVEHSAGRMETYVALTTDAATTGAIGKTLSLELLDHHNHSVSVELELIKGPGKLAKFGHLPPSQVVFESRSLSDDIGYLAFNSFLDGPGLIGKYNAALSQFQDHNGLVIDLRGNRGGLVLLVNGMCGWFVKERKSIGTMTMAGRPLQLQLNPRRPRFDKPVAVLIDECSISAAEIMSGGLKDIGAARIFGQTSAGLVLPSTIIKLPNGDGFQFALADYASASGTVLEGNGVQPDDAIKLTREMVKENRDPVLERAKAWILEHAHSETTDN